jgi:hypothetical protein
MDDLQANSSCQIKRFGKVIRIEPEATILEVNDKRILVPSSKVDDKVSPGDSVTWSGSLWITISAESNKAESDLGLSETD